MYLLIFSHDYLDEDNREASITCTRYYDNIEFIKDIATEKLFKSDIETDEDKDHYSYFSLWENTNLLSDDIIRKSDHYKKLKDQYDKALKLANIKDTQIKKEKN